MKKNSFIGGAFIATIGIFIVKIIGILYVIPFYQIIGEQGGALYGYAYNIYALFLAISSAGLPLAISKITSEYASLGYNKAKERAYYIGRNLITIVSVIGFISLFIFAPSIAKLIIGNMQGGNSLQDVAFVIRMISFSLLVVPYLSITKGYLQGHKYIGPTAVSQIIEQVVRVIVILFGSFFVLNIMHLSVKNAVGVALLGAFIGGIAAAIYLFIIMHTHKKELFQKPQEDEIYISDKEIVKKIITYALPLIIISLASNLYDSIDMILINRTMSNLLQIDAKTIESVISVYTTWGAKLAMIVSAIATGIITSLIPNAASSNIKGNKKDVNSKLNKSLEMSLLIIVPITLFLSLLAKPIWQLFYGSSIYGPLVFQVFIFTTLATSFYIIITSFLQSISKYKIIYITMALGLGINALLDVPIMLLFSTFSPCPYWIWTCHCCCPCLFKKTRRFFL
ncbi:MAG: polysaccharide biosynthesis protein [Bacilli bacterium]